MLMAVRLRSVSELNWAMPKILISYRRSDSAAIAGRLCDRLIARYGLESVFLDIDSIPFAIDFRDHVRATLRESDVVLAVVGTRWLGASDEHVRIHDEDDPVRVEIEGALQAGIPLLPVLVDGATMPKAPDLPVSLQRFAFINAAPVETGRDFHQHVDRLIRSLDQILGPKLAAPSTPRATEAAPGNDAGRPPAAAVISTGGLQQALRSPYPWAVAAVIALPFAAAYGALTPPWPPGVEIVTAMLEAVAFVLANHWLRPASRAAINRVIVATSIALAIASCAYMLAASVYIYQVPTTKERWVKGYACSQEAQLIYKDKCPHLGVDELRGAEYEAERLWSVQSIATVKVALVAMWLVAFISVATLIAGMLVHHAQQRNAAARPALEPVPR